jgi:hypothetical protein
MFAQYVQTNNSHFKQKLRAVKQNLVELASDKVSFSTEAASVIKNQQQIPNIPSLKLQQA